MIAGLGPLQPLLDDDAVTEVMINGPGTPVWVERAGVLHATDLVLDRAGIDLLVDRALAGADRRVDRRVPFVDARLPDGSRVNVVIPPIALDGPCVTIRRFRAMARGLDQLVPPVLAELLGWAVRTRANILVSGGAGAGKTTLLNALAACIPTTHRVVTIEDAAELHLQAAHVVRLESRPANAEGAGRVTVRDLLRNALRMRPDRLVIGEVRGAEALDLLHAMNTGHEGSLSTCHANSALDALRRVESMALFADAARAPAAVREQCLSAIDLIVHLTRDDHGARAVAEVAEVVPVDPPAVRSLYLQGRVVAAPARPPRVVGLAPPPVAEGGR